MKRLFQSVSVLLVLLLLTPPVWASMQCARTVDGAGSCKPCCAGMDGMRMPMDDQLQPVRDEQLTQSPCCIVTQTETAVSALLSDDEPIQHMALSPAWDADAFALLATGAEGRSLSPPQAAPRDPTLSRLCTLLL
jgi:hypothetical protein